MRVGVVLSREEFGPADLVARAVRAEQAGFSGLWISPAAARRSTSTSSALQDAFLETWADELLPRFR